LNIIPVDYVAKVIVKTFQRNDILQLTLWMTKALNFPKVAINHERSGI
jgi:hypothetical protein